MSTKPVRPTLDESGIVREPNLHDAALLGLWFSKNPTSDAADADPADLRVLVEAVGGQQYQLILLGVDYVFADEFQNQNVVYEVQVQRAPLPHMHHLTYLVGKATGRPEEDLPHWKIRMEREGLMLVIISTSFGMGLTALCRNLELAMISNGS